MASLRSTLPLEIGRNAFRSTENYDSVVAVPIHEINKDRLEVIDEIIGSNAYKTLEEVHESLLLDPTSTSKTLAQLEKVTQELRWRWKDLLRVKSSVIRIARQLPDVVEAIGDKQRASAAKPIIEILAELLERRHGLLIYDASPLLEESLVNLALQFTKGPKASEEELARRLEQVKQKPIDWSQM